MGTSRSLILSAGLALLGCGGTPAAKSATLPPAAPPPSGSPTKLISLQAIKAPKVDQVIGGGGMEARVSAGTLHDGDLRNCVASIVSATKEWRRDNKLVVELEDAGARRFLAHLRSPDPPGIFEVYYEFLPDGAASSVSLLFYKQSESVDDSAVDARFNLRQFGDVLIKELVCR